MREGVVGGDVVVGEGGFRESQPHARSEAAERESMSSIVTRRHRNRRNEWASHRRWCRVTCASTMACEVWQGRTW